MAIPTGTQIFSLAWKPRMIFLEASKNKGIWFSRKAHWSSDWRALQPRVVPNQGQVYHIFPSSVSLWESQGRYMACNALDESFFPLLGPFAKPLSAKIRQRMDIPKERQSDSMVIIQLASFAFWGCSVLSLWSYYLSGPQDHKHFSKWPLIKIQWSWKPSRAQEEEIATTAAGKSA